MKTFLCSIGLMLASLSPSLALAHGGRTNSSGCHNSSSGGYHCHGRSSGGSSSDYSNASDNYEEISTGALIAIILAPLAIVAIGVGIAYTSSETRSAYSMENELPINVNVSSDSASLGFSWTF